VSSFFFFQAEDGIRDFHVTGVQTCALPIYLSYQYIFIFLYPNEYTSKMYFIEKTNEFDKWLKKLKDLRAKAKILVRIQKLENEEHFGEWKTVGDGISELKINYAKGYRIYFKEKDGKIIVLLV